jgi:transcriptional regulator with XRE-family HTH domain
MGNVNDTVFKKLRLNRRMTQSELSMKSGIDQGQISAIERGLQRPGLEHLQKLSAALNVSMDTFRDGDVFPEGKNEVANSAPIEMSPEAQLLAKYLSQMTEEQKQKVLEAALSLLNRGK